jgi:hypothetical protein
MDGDVRETEGVKIEILRIIFGGQRKYPEEKVTAS